MPRDLWDLSSPTRDWTRPTAMKARNPDHWATKELPILAFWSFHYAYEQNGVPHFSETVHFFSFFFSLCFLDCVIYFSLSSSLLFLSFAGSELLLSSSLSYCTFQLHNIPLVLFCNFCVLISFIWCDIVITHSLTSLIMVSFSLWTYL